MLWLIYARVSPSFSPSLSSSSSSPSSSSSFSSSSSTHPFLSLSLSLFSFLRLVLLYSFLVFLFLPAVAIFSRVYVQTIYASTRRGYTSALKIFARAVFSRRCEIARVLYRFKLWDSTLLFESLPSLYDIAGSAFFLVSSSREMKIENFHDHIESKKCIQFDCAI